MPLVTRFWLVSLLGVVFWGTVSCSSTKTPPTPIEVLPTQTLVVATSTATFTPTATPTLIPTLLNPLETLTPESLPPLPETLSTPLKGLLEAIVADAANATGINPDEIQVVGLKTVLSADSRLTCTLKPPSEKSTFQAVYRVVVIADEVRVYYARNEDQFLHCEGENLLDQTGTALYVDLLMAELVQLAQNDLARRLSIRPDSIQVVDVLTLTWRDRSLGCPLPDDIPQAQLTTGYRILLQANGQIYPYHTDFISVQYCPPERERLPIPFQATATPTITPTALPTAIPSPTRRP